MLNAAATAAATEANRRLRAERKEHAARLLNVGIAGVAEISRRLEVSKRTAARYLRELHGGGDRRVILYPALKPLVLEHLRMYPHLRISGYMLARALRIGETSHKVVERALRSLEQDGLVRQEVSTRREGDYRPHVKVYLWSLAEQGQPDGQ